MEKFIPKIKDDDTGFDIDDTSKLLCRKELLMAKIPDDVKVTNNGSEAIVSYPTLVDIDSLSKKHLSLQSYQIFTKNFFNIYSPYDFLHLFFMAGAGKTLASLSIAKEFVRKYEMIYRATLKSYPNGNYYRDLVNKKTPRVIIVGTQQTRTAFYNELISRPEFDMVSTDEYIELERLRKLAEETNDPVHEKNYKSLRRQYKKRISDKYQGGFYEFYTVDQIPNELFITTSSLKEVLEEAFDSNNIDTIKEKLKSGDIKINKQFLSLFRDSLVIIDEFHNLYNSDGLNTRGYALMYIIDEIRSLGHSNMRIVALTATPFNNSIVEAVYYVNFMVRKENRVEVKDLFDSNGNPKPGTIEKIALLTNGKVAFLEDNTAVNFPKKTIPGEKVIVDGQELPYLNFIKCPASPIHEQKIRDHDSLKVAQESVDLFSIVFPNPDNPDDAFYDSESIRKYYFQNKDSEKLRDLEIEVIQNSHIGGRWLRKENLAKYSTKYVTMLNLLEENINKNLGKVVIYNKKVHGSGVRFIGEILRENGYVLYGDNPDIHSICLKCKKRYDQHKKDDHEFHPIRFVVIYNEVKAHVEKYISIFNDVDNVKGKNLYMIVGAKMITESYTLLAVRQMIITSSPDNIASLHQLFGRGVRNRSHDLLPPEEREVFIYVLITTVSFGTSIEEEYYRNKLERYRYIQLQQREIIKYAIEGDIHRKIIMTKSKLAEYFEDGTGIPKEVFGTLYYEPYYTTENCDKATLLTFTTHGHHKDEVKQMIHIIKRLFYTQPVWTYVDLWKNVQNPPFKMNMNPHLFSEGNFTIALTALLFDDSDRRIIINQEKQGKLNVQEEIDKLYDNYDRHIYRHGVKHIIKQIGDKYIAFPLLLEHNIPNSDVENYLRPPAVERQVSIDLKKALKNVSISKMFNRNLEKIVEKYSQDDVRLIDIFTEYESDFHKSLIKYYVEKRDKRIKNIIKLYDDLDLLYKENNIIVGYKDSKSNVIYKNNEWIETQSHPIKWEENNIIIGYYEFVSKPQFKLRPVGRKVVTDKRHVEKGIVCSSLLKEFLLNLAKKLGIKEKIERRHSLCEAIETELITREITERQKKSNIKYIYIW